MVMMTRGRALHSPLIKYSKKFIKWGVVLDDNGGYDNDGGNEEQQKTQKKGVTFFFLSTTTYKEVVMTMMVTTTTPSPLFTKKQKGGGPPFGCKLWWRQQRCKSLHIPPFQQAIKITQKRKWPLSLLQLAMKVMKMGGKLPLN